MLKVLKMLTHTTRIQISSPRLDKLSLLAFPLTRCAQVKILFQSKSYTISPYITVLFSCSLSHQLSSLGIHVLVCQHESKHLWAYMQRVSCRIQTHIKSSYPLVCESRQKQRKLRGEWRLAGQVIPRLRGTWSSKRVMEVNLVRECLDSNESGIRVWWCC